MHSFESFFSLVSIAGFSSDPILKQIPFNILHGSQQMIQVNKKPNLTNFYSCGLCVLYHLDKITLHFSMAYDGCMSWKKWMDITRGIHFFSSHSTCAVMMRSGGKMLFDVYSIWIQIPFHNRCVLNCCWGHIASAVKITFQIKNQNKKWSHFNWK